MYIQVAVIFVDITSANVQEIAFLYNVQHDCPLANCTASGRQPLIQERVQSGLFKTYIEHKPIERFVINTHAFHNVHRLRAALQRSLVAPIPLYPPEIRREKHNEFARRLRATQKAKLDARAAQKKKGEKDTADSDKMESVIPKKRARSDMEAEEAGANKDMSAAV